MGRQVRVKWKSGSFDGKIVGFEEGKFCVQYSDGDRKLYKMHKKEFCWL